MHFVTSQKMEGAFRIIANECKNSPISAGYKNYTCIFLSYRFGVEFHLSGGGGGGGEEVFQNEMKLKKT